MPEFDGTLILSPFLGLGGWILLYILLCCCLHTVYRQAGVLSTLLGARAGTKGSPSMSTVGEGTVVDLKVVR